MSEVPGLPSERWLRFTLVTALACVAITLALIIAAARIAVAQGLIFLAPLASYLTVALRLRSRRPQGIKKGLAWAVVGGPFGVILGFALSTERGPWLFLIVPFTLAQVLLAIGAIKTYYSMDGEAGDMGMIVKRVAFAFVAYFTVGEVIMFRFNAPHRYVASEQWAVSMLRTLTAAEIGYASQHGVGYTDTLTKLCSPETVIDPNLCGGGGGALTAFTSEGYRVTYRPASKADQVTRYTIQADPTGWESEGKRFFFVDETSVVRATSGRPAAASDPPI